MIFYANASIKHNKNSIMVLQNGEDMDVFKHEEKADILWTTFNDRSGISEFSHVRFDLNEFLQNSIDLEALAQPISKQEVDNVIRNLPSGKSLDPNGFNTDSMNKCWSVISQDFYYLCEALYQHNLCVQSINGSYIVLVPKVDNPRKVSDYRPISLLNSSIELITKILENRLQSVILGIMNQN
jgi:hypothetical protein